MTTTTWDAIDQAAEREADALRAARRYRSPFEGSVSSGVTRDQAVWDEGLEEQATSCSFCGRTLTPKDDANRDEDMPQTESLHMQDSPVCRGCAFLDEFIRKVQSR